MPSNKSDNGRAEATETVDVTAWSDDELRVISAFELDPATVNPAVVEALLTNTDPAEVDERLQAREQGLRAGANMSPAVESGPHLKDKEVRAAKVAQLRAAGITGGLGNDLPDDMRSLLNEVDRGQEG